MGILKKYEVSFLLPVSLLLHVPLLFCVLVHNLCYVCLFKICDAAYSTISEEVEEKQT